MVIAINIFSLGYSIKVNATEANVSEVNTDNSASSSGISSDYTVRVPHGKFGRGSIYTSLTPRNNVYSMKFGFIENIKDIISISDDETLALNAGKDLNFVLKSKIIEDTNVSNEEVDILKESIINSDINGIKPLFINYLDISFYKEIQLESHGIKNKVEKLNSPVSLVIKNPETDSELKENYRRDIYVFTVNENEVVTMEGPLRAVNGFITFSMQKSGVAALTYIDVFLGTNNNSKPSFVPKDYNTSPGEIRDKIDSYANSPERESVIFPIYSPDDEPENISESEGAMIQIPKRNPFSLLELFFVIFLVDFVIIGIYILISILRRNKIA